MRRVGILLTAAAAVLMTGGVAGAQTSDEPGGYGEVFAQSAFSNVTSQSYGVEAGMRVWETVQVFGEFGQVRDVASDAISAGAQLIAAALTNLQGTSVGYSVKQPVLFFGGGVRYPIAMEQTKIRPYVLAGAGVARVKNDVTFTLAGSSASSASLEQLVTLGSDLTGSVTKPMITFGAGAQWPAWDRLVIDFQYRLGRIFTDQKAITVSRLGLGLGFSF